MGCITRYLSCPNWGVSVTPSRHRRLTAFPDSFGLRPFAFPVLGNTCFSLTLQKLHNSSAWWVCQPWRCLCFGFSQMILIDPFLLMTLHFSQIGLTDDLTFTGNPPSICEMCHAGPGQDPCITKACSFGRTDTRNQARTVYFIIDCTEMQADN